MGFRPIRPRAGTYLYYKVCLTAPVLLKASGLPGFIMWLYDKHKERLYLRLRLPGDERKGLKITELNDSSWNE